MPISWRRENDKTEKFSQKIEHSGGVIVLPLTPLFSFVTFHLNQLVSWLSFLMHGFITLSDTTSYDKPI